MFTNKHLRETYLSPAMERYFHEKLPAIPQQELAIQIEECLKFLFIAQHCRGSIPVTKAIDEVWHLWILETKEYVRLCSALGEGDYIHHSSDVFGRCAGEPRPENGLEDDVGVLGTYVLNFGPFKAQRIRYWRMASYLVTRGGMSLHDLNEWLRSGVSAVGEGHTGDEHRGHVRLEGILSVAGGAHRVKASS